jgi:hypothetical protein
MRIIRNFAAATAVAVTFAFIVTGDASAQGMKVGELKDLSAWVNKMPPGPFSLYAIGKITAPTPCYDALAEYAGEDKSNPPVYRIKITLRQHPGNCIQKLSDISFRYAQPNYVGNDANMTIFSDQDSKTIAIDVVQ